MGATFSALSNRFFEKKKIRIFMEGLDGAGKTTIQYKLVFGTSESVNMWTVSSVSCYLEIIEYKNVCLHIWANGGGCALRQFHRKAFSDTRALIHVIDSNDKERMDEAAMELSKMLEVNQFPDSVVLVLANKQDLPNAMSTDELTERLGEVSQLRNRKWHVQSTSAITGEGIYEGLDWLINEVSKLP